MAIASCRSGRVGPPYSGGGDTAGLQHRNRGTGLRMARMRVLTNTAWVVVLEAVRKPGANDIDVRILTGLLEVLSRAEPYGVQPLALLASDRYALHLSVNADDVSEALLIAVLRWKEATRNLGLIGWDGRRAEVLTKIDFELEAQPLADCIWPAEG